MWQNLTTICRSTRARSLLFLSEFEAIFSCSVIDQARKVRIAAVFLLTSSWSYWLSFLGLLTTTHHSQVNRLQLADDPLKQLVLSRHHFLLRKRLALPPSSEQSSLGLVGPRTHLEQKEGTKQTLNRRVSNNCSTQAKCLETNLEKRSCQLFYYCVHMARKTTSLCYVSFYVRCSVFHLGYVSLYVRCSVLDLPTGGSRVLCTCTAAAGRYCVAVQSVFGCACARNFLLWNCFLYELFRIFRLLAWLISFRRC